MKYFKGTSRRTRRKAKVTSPKESERESPTDVAPEQASPIRASRSAANKTGQKRTSSSSASSQNHKKARHSKAEKQHNEDDSSDKVANEIDMDNYSNSSTDNKQSSTRQGKRRTSSRSKASSKQTEANQERNKPKSVTDSRKRKQTTEGTPQEVQPPGPSQRQTSKGNKKRKAKSSSENEHEESSTQNQRTDDTEGISKTRRGTNKRAPVKRKKKKIAPTLKSISMDASEESTEGHASHDVACPPSEEEEDSIFDSERSDTLPGIKRTTDVESDGALTGDSADDKVSDRQFLNTQVALLRKPFELDDCEDLAKVPKSQQRKHIPQDTVVKVLRRLNHNLDDELLKHLNRQAQLRVLQTVSQARHEQSMEEKGSESDHEIASEERLEIVRKEMMESKGKLESLKALLAMCAEMESKVEQIEEQPFAAEVKRANKLVDQIAKKLKSQGTVSLPRPQENITELHRKRSQTHKKIVDKLFGH